MRDPTSSVIYVLIIYFFGPFDLFKFGSFLTHGPTNNEKSARFISFDSNDGKINLELNLGVPFVTIPLKNKDTNKGTAGQPSPLVTINTKGIAVLGILLATSAFIVPLFFKPIPQVHQHYRMDEDLQWWNIGHTVNDVLLRNGYVTPCVQRILCSIVNEVKRSKNPTSTGKMIDGIFSHRWFQQFANGSVIMDAIKTGDEGTEKYCPTAYKGCLLNQKIIDNSLKAVELELTVPFISVPGLRNKEGKNNDGQPESLVSINTKGIAVLGILLATSAFLVPSFIESKPIPQDQQHYRIEQDSNSWNIGQTLNDFLTHDGYVTSCLQRTLCSLLTTVNRPKNPTSSQKIVNALLSNKWLQKYVNGSLIMEAMEAIRTGKISEKDCFSYKGCPLSEKTIDSMLRVLNII